MRWTSSLSERVDVTEAVSEALAQLNERHEGEVPDLVVCFVSGFDHEACEIISDYLVDAFPRATVVGCTAEGVVGSDREIERRRSVALLAATLPGVALTAFHLDQPTIDDAQPWAHALLPPSDEEPMLLMFADPFQIDVERALKRLGETHPEVPVIGGLASQASEPGENILFMNGEMHHTGLVGVAIHGNLRADFVVSQGCRPLGEPYIVTQADTNWIQGLRGRPALEILRDMVLALDDHDRVLAEKGLLIGRAISEYKSEFQAGDFLIQGIIGANPDTGSIAIAGDVRLGSTIQFHVLDATAADEDLRSLCALLDEEYAGGLLFTCNGRGTRMWEQPNHDVSVFQEMFGPLPLAGFFAAGELGPLGGQNLIHGFTLSAALFRPAK